MGQGDQGADAVGGEASLSQLRHGSHLDGHAAGPGIHRQGKGHQAAGPLPRLARLRHGRVRQGCSRYPTGDLGKHGCGACRGPQRRGRCPEPGFGHCRPDPGTHGRPLRPAPLRHTQLLERTAGTDQPTRRGADLRRGGNRVPGLPGRRTRAVWSEAGYHHIGKDRRRGIARRRGGRQIRYHRHDRPSWRPRMGQHAARLPSRHIQRQPPVRRGRRHVSGNGCHPAHQQASRCHGRQAQSRPERDIREDGGCRPRPRHSIHGPRRIGRL